MRSSISLYISLLRPSSVYLEPQTADATYGGDANPEGSTADQVTFAITQRAITVTAVINSKPYDGNISSARADVLAGTDRSRQPIIYPDLRQPECVASIGASETVAVLYLIACRV